ncbi:MAG: hypothetical protein MJA27_14430 [Pseudanabaenales cyanobacterium]|nr:hypothetical protein [Pseudanabaenales cyanobacterium]
MIANKVDTDFTDKDLKAVMDALETIREKLPFLVGLSVEERRRLSKLGRKSQTFTHQALDMATQHPELMPACLNLEEARRDMNLFVSLNPVLQVLSELQRLVKDTQTVAGSEAYAAARVAYASAKSMGKGLGLDDVVGTLSMRFDRTSSSTPAQTTP